MNKEKMPSAEEFLREKIQNRAHGSELGYMPMILCPDLSRIIQEYAELCASHGKAKTQQCQTCQGSGLGATIEEDCGDCRGTGRKQLPGIPSDEELSAWDEHSSPHSQEYCSGYEEGAKWMRDTYLVPLQERVKELEEVVLKKEVEETKLRQDEILNRDRKGGVIL